MTEPIVDQSYKHKRPLYSYSSTKNDAQYLQNVLGVREKCSFKQAASAVLITVPWY